MATRFRKLLRNRRRRILRDNGIIYTYSYGFIDDVTTTPVALTFGDALSFDVTIQKTVGMPEPVTTPISAVCSVDPGTMGLILKERLAVITGIDVTLQDASITITANQANREAFFANIMLT